MSGSAKNLVYRIFQYLLWVAALVGGMLVLAYGTSAREDSLSGTGIVVMALCFFAVSVFFPLDVLVHELGHLCFGLLAGMRCTSLTVSFMTVSFRERRIFFRAFSPSAGATQFRFLDVRSLRGRTIFASLGGALTNLLIGSVLLCVFFFFPEHPVLVFFAMFAPANLCSGVLSLIPVELPAGKTDGRFVLSLCRREASSALLLRVMEIQAMLDRKTFAELDRTLFLDFPVVREDDPAFLAFLQLKWKYLFEVGEREEAFLHLDRLEELTEYLSEGEYEEAVCDLIYSYAVLRGNPSRAESLRIGLKFRSGLCYRYRAEAALASGEARRAALAAAERARKKERMVGIAQSEKKLLEQFGEYGNLFSEAEKENMK